MNSIVGDFRIDPGSVLSLEEFCVKTGAKYFNLFTTGNKNANYILKLPSGSYDLVDLDLNDRFETQLHYQGPNTDSNRQYFYGTSYGIRGYISMPDMMLSAFQFQVYLSLIVLPILNFPWRYNQEKYNEGDFRTTGAENIYWDLYSASKYNDKNFVLITQSKKYLLGHYYQYYNNPSPTIGLVLPRLDKSSPITTNAMFANNVIETKNNEMYYTYSTQSFTPTFKQITVVGFELCNSELFVTQQH